MLSSPPSSSPPPLTFHQTFPTVPLIDTSFDFFTIALILCFLFLSLLSFCFIIHLKIKSRQICKLRAFSSYWVPRILLVVILSLWSINEFLRLPIFRKNYIFPFLPSLNLSDQTKFCKIHLILSFGLCEPGFLVVLLLLVNISTKKRSPGNLWAIGFVVITCLPLVVALYLGIYVLPGRLYLQPIFYRSSMLLHDSRTGAQAVYCTYPLIGGLIFSCFGVVYVIVFLANCWKVAIFVINKRLKARINLLNVTVLTCLVVQVLMLTMTAFWNPDNVWFYGFAYVSFVSIITCGSVVEGILVILPSIDSLKAAPASVAKEEEVECEDDEFV